MGLLKWLRAYNTINTAKRNHEKDVKEKQEKHEQFYEEHLPVYSFPPKYRHYARKTEIKCTIYEIEYGRQVPLDIRYEVMEMYKEHMDKTRITNDIHFLLTGEDTLPPKIGSLEHASEQRKIRKQQKLELKEEREKRKKKQMELKGKKVKEKKPSRKELKKMEKENKKAMKENKNKTNYIKYLPPIFIIEEEKEEK